MKTIGTLIHQTRKRKKYSLEFVEKKTRIKKEFIRLIEKEKWDELPEYPVLLGFVKTLAGFLQLNEKQVLALLRRDYPPRKVNINPKPDVEKRFSFTPRLTFFVGILIFAFAGSTYFIS